jgi:hypothetical protein
MPELTAPPEKFIEWLRGIETVGCIRIEARHLIAGQEAGSVVATFEIGEQEDGGERFNAPMVYRRLEEDAENIGGVQRYTLLAFREGAKAPRDRLTLKVDGGADGDAASSEPANASGLVSQAHRHNEALLTMVVRMCGAALDTLAKQNTRLAEQLEKAQETQVEAWGIMREMALHDRDKETQRHTLALREKQADVMRDGLKLVLPGLVAKVLPSNTVQDEGLSRLIESLTDDQRSAIFSMLTPEQSVAMGGLLDTIIKKKTQEEVKEKTNGTT